MQLPFNQEQFMAMFATYNNAIFPAQIIAYALAVVALWFCFRPAPIGDRIIAAILALFWLWNGIVFQWMHFSQINPTARMFGVAVALQGILFAWAGVVRTDLRFGLTGSSAFRWIGGLMITYAMVLYPLIGLWSGHRYPAMPIFGVAPCPTTIFTFGLLLWTVDRVPKYVLIIPLLWSLLGVAAAFSLGIPEDFALPLSGLVATGMLLWRDRGHSASHADAHPSPA